MNVFTAEGRLGADPETRTINDKLSVTTFRFATNGRKDKEGKESTLWLRVQTWNRGDFGIGAKLIQPHAKKGDLVFVTGALEQEEYKDKDGNDKTNLKLELSDGGFRFLGSKSDREDAASAPAATTPTKTVKTATKKNDVPLEVGNGADIPF